MAKARSRFGLTGNQLKLLALILMTLDHIGAYLLPQVLWLRIVGRLAMPIFAFMIAEGCRYTKSRIKYLALLLVSALLYQIAAWFFMHSLEMCIMVTFFLSAVLIFILDMAQKKKSFWLWLLFAAAVIGVYWICQYLPGKVRGFSINYGFWGVMLPVLVYLGQKHWQNLILCAIGLAILSYGSHYLQWYSLLSLPLLALYSGKRGSWKLKYFFYLYYPLHLGALYLIKQALRYLDIL